MMLVDPFDEYGGAFRMLVLKELEERAAERRARREAWETVDRGHFYPVRDERLTPTDATISDHRPMDAQDL